MSFRRFFPLKYFFALAAFAPVSYGPASLPELPVAPSILDEDRIECTTGVAMGAATEDGRPLLWKNRDLTGGHNQQFHYVADMGIPFISVTTLNLVGQQYYGGVNATGFAIENSNSYNLGDGVVANGWGADSDDGFVQAHALATCTTVDDFQALLDSTNHLGRTHISNYGVIDAYGGAAIFECAAQEYMRWDAAEAPGGFLVRSNFSYWNFPQDTLSNLIPDCGVNRHDSAYNLFKAARDSGNLSAEYIFQRVARDLHLWGINARPLPFDGYYGDYPYGCFPTGNTVCRESTRSLLIVQGVNPDQPPEDAILWAVCGSPFTAVATPLWVRAGSVPDEYHGANGSRICNRALTLRNYVFVAGEIGLADTKRLVRPDGSGLWDFTLPLERWVFRKTAEFVSSPNFSYDRLESFQNRLARQVADSLDSWKCAYDVTDLVLGDSTDYGITLNWDVEPTAPDDTSGQFFRVYRNSEPFREASGGELLATTESPSFTDPDPIEGAAFYRVEAVPR